MSTEYLKSLSTDFNGNVILSQLHDEIIGNTMITTAFQGITSYLDDIVIIFESSLSNVEISALDGIIYNHMPDFAPKRLAAYRIYPETRKVKSDSWTFIGSFQFPGTKYNGDINYVDIIANTEIPGMTYDVQITQRSTNAILVEDSLSNSTVQNTSLTILQAFPEDIDIIEISVKSSNRMRYVNIQEITLWYGN